MTIQSMLTLNGDKTSEEAGHTGHRGCISFGRNIFAFLKY